MSLSWLIANLVSSLLLPPGNGLVLAVAGLFLWRLRPRLARFLVTAGVFLVTALSLGVVARALLAPLEARHPPLPPAALARLPVDAIVVLGAGRYRSPPEFGDDDVSGSGLERLRYAALERDFGVRVRWVESASADTAENARHSAGLLLPAGAQRIALVTHAWHMPRATAAFAAAGFAVTPAPTAFAAARPATPLDFVPRAPAMQQAATALHEWFGLAWYALRR
ncbi:YdcF family protein [Azospira restricta]|uniref:YdcF family protein n=1 Tax=Azospira restricta TaxID=404405 RepID=A0A974SN46_9RHOO|nr:ElyC/SanA/YdcF family protein [Azospira restricta]QRJ62318.1 YdcF family protein [Azospira restricta]